jgi:excisionase family DNA binding protein
MLYVMKFCHITNAPLTVGKMTKTTTGSEKYRWRSIPWLAEMLAISKSHAYRLVEDGHFISVNLGRNGSKRGYRVREDSVYSYLERKVLAMSLADPAADQ